MLASGRRIGLAMLPTADFSRGSGLGRFGVWAVDCLGWFAGSERLDESYPGPGRTHTPVTFIRFTPVTPDRGLVKAPIPLR
jgi:hypothetical protein